MKQAPIQHAIEAFGFDRLRRSILGRPHEQVRSFGARFGRWAYRLLVGPRRVAERNLSRVFPKLAEDERRQIALACFEHFGGHFAETLSMARFDRDAALERFDIEGWEHLEALERGGEGFFFHTGHFGTWEMALYPFALRLGNVQAVARPLDNPRIDVEMRALRERFGIRLIDKAGAGRRMRSAVRAGARVAIVIDQHVRPSAGVRVPFLGHPAWTSPVLALLALRLAKPVVPFTCRPLPEGRYHLRIDPPIVGEGRGMDAEIEMTRRIFAPLEDDIRRRPELWLWMHRRWRDAAPPRDESSGT